MATPARSAATGALRQPLGSGGSNDPAFAEKLVDIVGLYLNPPDRALVLAVDEKSQIRALDHRAAIPRREHARSACKTQPGLPLRKGRAGTLLNVLDGTVIGRCAKRHRHQEFIRFLGVIDASTPADLDLHLVVDNYATHKHPAVKDWLARHPRFHLHFTPTSPRRPGSTWSSASSPRSPASASAAACSRASPTLPSTMTIPSHSSGQPRPPTFSTRSVAGSKH